MNKKILVLGATGFLGRAVCRLLDKKKIPYFPTSLSLGTDLRDPSKTIALFQNASPDEVLNCASFVGGIQWGIKRSADIFDSNLRIIANMYKAAQNVGVKRIVNPISNCVYPAKATLFKELEIWDGALHETVEIYGLIRKISWAGSKAYSNQYKMDTLNIVLSNMYGPEDHFEEERSHALGALVMKIVQAKKQNLPQVFVWGSGKPVREWLHVDDGAQAMLRAIDAPATTDFINIGVAEGVSILEMANQIKEIVGYQGKLVLDTSKPDGAPYKTVDGSKGEKLLGWKPEISFKDGLRSTINWYISQEI